MSAAFFLLQYVYLSFELGMRMNGARLAQYLSSFDFVSLYTSQECADVVTCLCSVKKLSEHFDTGYNDFSLLFGQTYDFNFVTDFEYASFYSTGRYGTTSGDGEYVLNRHQERLVVVSFRFRNVAVYCFEQLHDLVAPRTCRIL